MRVMTKECAHSCILRNISLKFSKKDLDRGEETRNYNVNQSLVCGCHKAANFVSWNLSSDNEF